MPIISPVRVALPSDSTARARPKSATFTTPSSDSRMFSGLTSRWTSPARCAAESALSTDSMTDTASATSRRPRSRSRSRKRAAVDQLHDEEHVRAAGAVIDALVVHRDGVQVGEPRGRPGFAGEAIGEGGVRRQGGRHDLDRHQPVEPLVDGGVHGRHPAAGDPVDDAVPALEFAADQRVRGGRVHSEDSTERWRPGPADAPGGLAASAGARSPPYRPRRSGWVTPGPGSGWVSGDGEEPAAALTTRLGRVELLTDPNRPGGYLLLIDRIRQSYVDVDDPTYLEFEYIQAFADVIDALPRRPAGGDPRRGRRLHARAVRGRDPAGLVADRARARCRPDRPGPLGAAVRARRCACGSDRSTAASGLTGLADASADVLALDAFLGGRVPAELTTVEFFADVARVLRPSGVLLVNVADGPPGTFLRRLLASVTAELPNAVAIADPAVLKLRRYGNVVLAASRAPLPMADITAASVRAMFPRRVLAGARLLSFVGGAAPLTDADPMRSPQPPEDIWRVS